MILAGEHNIWIRRSGTGLTLYCRGCTWIRHFNENCSLEWLAAAAGYHLAEEAVTS